MFAIQFNKKTDRINDIISNYLPAENEHDDYIIKSVRYSVSAGGKRIRPLLMEEAFDLYSIDSNKNSLYSFMAAIEFIHSYSLVHDDLPAMDDAKLRRGKAATHIVFGEAFGVLAGDALLNLAYETIAKRMAQTDSFDDLKRCVQAFEVLSKKSGISGMVGGQSLDVLSEKERNGRLSEEELNFIYENKTGALIEASLMIGAILAGADDRAVRKMADIGSAIGLSYQIEDDIIDIYGDESITGKDSNSDIKNQKTTYVNLYGKDKAKEMSEFLVNKAITEIEEFGQKGEFLKSLFLYLIKRDN